MQIEPKALARCPLFGSLTSDELTQVVEASRPITVSSGDFVFREGQPCDGLFVIANGSVRLYKIGPDGRERTLHIVRAPQAFAEAALFGRAAYPAFATAIGECQLILVRREPFLRMLRQQPDTALRLMESLSGWMHRLLDQLENETFLSARAKLASYLLRAVRQQGGSDATQRIELQQPKKDVASQLGMAPETFSRALADLEDRGLIRPTGRRVELLDHEALEGLLLGENA